MWTRLEEWMSENCARAIMVGIIIQLLVIAICIPVGYYTWGWLFTKFGWNHWLINPWVMKATHPVFFYVSYSAGALSCLIYYIVNVVVAFECVARFTKAMTKAGVIK